MLERMQLAGLWSHQKGGFYHDGRFATLKDVVDHYNTLLKLGLTEPDKADSSSTSSPCSRYDDPNGD